MKKRILAVLLVLALVISAGVVAVMATDGNDAVATSDATVVKCPCHGMTLEEIDASEENGWVEFAGAMENGVHYRLTADYTAASSGTTMVTLAAGSNVKTILNLNGCTLTNSRSAGGRLLSLADSEVTICGGGEVKGGGNGGGVIYMNAGGIVNLYDTTLTNTRSAGTTAGGVVDVNAEGAVFNMYSGTLNGGNHAAEGGAVRVYKGQFNMHSGVINASTNAANKTGGAICVYNYATAALNIYGGTINAGVFTGNGDTIYVYPSAKFNIEGGTICGEAFVRGTVTVSGAPEIEELNLNGGMIAVGTDGLSDGAVIGVNVAENTAFATVENAEAYAKYFYSRANDFRGKVAANDGALSLVANNACPHCDDENIEWVAYTNQKDSGHYYLTADKSTSSQYEIGDNDTTTENNIVLDLNSHTFNDTASRFSIRAGVKFYLLDSGVGGEMIGHRSNDSGGVISLSQDAHFTMYSGKVTDGLDNRTGTTIYGGAIGFASTGTSVVIKGGTITGNSAAYGAAIGVRNGASVKIEGGTIIGGTVLKSGGAISVTGGGTLEMTGGKVIGGTATEYGGAIYVSGGTAYISGGTVADGVATSFGGNIYNTGTVEISGGTITGGKTDADAYGGGNIYNGGTLKVSGTAIIEKGERTNSTTSAIRGGGNIYNLGGTVEISGGIIRDGIVAKSDSGANILSRTGSITISGGTISGGTHKNSGTGLKGVNCYHGDVTIKGNPNINDIGIGDTRYPWKSFTISGTPTIGLLDVVTAGITLGEGGVTGGSITVNAAEGTPFSTANAELAESSKAFFFGADGLFGGVDADGCLILTAYVAFECPHCHETLSEEDWTEWNGKTQISDSGHYFVSADVATNSNSQIKIGDETDSVADDIVIDLRGCTVNHTGSRYSVRKGDSLSLMDSRQGGELIGHQSGAGGAIQLHEGATFVLYSGTVTDGFAGTRTGTPYGGAIDTQTTNTKVIIKGGTVNGGSAYYGAAIGVRGAGASLTIEGGTINGGTATYGGAIYAKEGTVTISGGTITNGNVYIDTSVSVTLSGAPVIEELNLTEAAPIVLNEMTSGADITVIAAVGKAFTEASDYAQAALDNAYIKSTVENAELKCVDNCLVLQIPVLKAFCEHCGEEAGEQDWLPLTAESYTANGTGATLPDGHYYLPADLSNQNRVNMQEGQNICLDLHGKTLTATNIMPFWVRYAEADLAIMDTVGGGELQGGAGNGYGGGVIRLTNGSATLYAGTLRYIGTRGTDNGGIIYNNAATFNMNGGHLADGKTVGRGAVMYVSGEGVVNINGGTMELGTAADGYNGIYLVNNNSTLNVGADATEALEVLDGNVTGNAYSPINMPYGIGLATVDADATVRCTWYADTAEAIAAYSQTGNYLKVLGNTGDLTLDGTYIVDLAGNSITITGGTVYGMDSANDEFDATACGVATVEAPATYCVAPNGSIYIAVEGENGFTFHRLRMAFNRLSLRPGVAGVYYSSSWTGDAVLTGTVSDMEYETESKITGYGMALKKNEAATGESFENGDKFAYTFFDNAEGIASNFLANKNGKEINSCLLSNIINAENGAEINDQNAQVLIYATPYVQFLNYEGNTEYVMGPAYGNNLYGIVKYVVDTIAAMEDADARAKNVNKIAALETFADACDVTFEGLTDLIHPTEPAPEETTAPTVAE